ncbi:MAG: diaminopimelate epimerase, partial [Elusimicrobiota bacterium]|nr:diaminopimelate epimerase [Elusimicrobiota bacterium]
KICNYLKLAKKLCQRHFSVGADGLLIVENSTCRGEADFKMLYFNSDGSQAAMCGNGARCVAYYAYINKIAERQMQFETLAGVIKAKVTGSKVRISLADPKDIKLDFSLKLDNKEFNVSFVDTGVPHTVIFVSELDGVDVKNLGKKIRYHEKFLPEGTNVNFVKVVNEHTLNIRTYERGIEDETYACGTGAVASAVIAAMKNLVKSPVRCRTTGGEILTVYFKVASKDELLTPVYDIHLEGKVKLVFTGTIIDK